MCELGPKELDKHLFNDLIPAIASRYPCADGKYYDAKDVQQWLGTLADHLAKMVALGYSGTDLYLHRLWRTTFRNSDTFQAERPPQRVTVRLVSREGRRRASARPIFISGLLGSMLVIALAFIPKAEGKAALRFSLTPAEWIAKAVIVILLAIVLGLFCAGLTVLVLAAPPDGRLKFEFAAGLRGIERPGSLMRSVWVFDIVRAVVFGVGVGGLMGLSVGALAWEFVGLVEVAFGGGWEFITVLALDPDVHPAGPPSHFVITVATIAAASFTLPFLAMAADEMRRSPWLRYILALRTLSRDGRLPNRLGRFLDWAYSAGMIRMSGAAIQFRHLELQNYLAGQSPTGVEEVGDQTIVPESSHRL
jgi:hypothetical protein